jgi:NADH-quinone oxidoreductase subunit C
MDVIIKWSFYLYKILPGVSKITILNDKYVILVLEKDWVKVVIKILKNKFILNSVLDIWCVDYPEKKERFEINYLLVSYKNNLRLILRIYVKDNVGIETISDVFASAGWLEREIWDMYGIFFYNNVDLRRILTDYGFEGFPLRKDFPMSGFVEIRYDDTEKRIVQEVLEVAQDYRNFNFKSPWEKL